MQQTPAEILNQYRYDQNIIPEQETPVFTIDGKTVGTLENFVTFCGLPKAGKSKFIAATVASSFMPGDIFGLNITLPAERKKIGYFDTEQSSHDFHRHMTLVKNFAGINGFPDWFNAFRFREIMKPQLIQQLIISYLDSNKDCSLIIIDGLLDLLRNFNDEVESKELINWLKMIGAKYNVLTVTVLHTGKQQGFTIGHLGSMVDRYCQSLLKIDKDKTNGIYTLSEEMLRSADYIDPISIVNVGGQWMKTHTPGKKEKQQAKVIQLDQHKQHLHNIFTYKKQYTYRELATAIAEEYAIGTNKAKQLITELKTKNLLQKNSNELYERTA